MFFCANKYQIPDREHVQYVLMQATEILTSLLRMEVCNPKNETVEDYSQLGSAKTWPTYVGTS